MVYRVFVPGSPISTPPHNLRYEFPQDNYLSLQIYRPFDVALRRPGVARVRILVINPRPPLALLQRATMLAVF